MRKLLSILVAGVFAVSMNSVFAASHMKAASDKPAEAKSGEMTKDDTSKGAKSTDKKKSSKKSSTKSAKKDSKKDVKEPAAK